MEQDIARWYQSSGIFLATPEQYKQRVESIGRFTKEEFDISVYCELIKSFMGWDYDVEKLSDFVSIFNESDISFSKESRQEIPLLAGICILKDVAMRQYDELGVMISLAHERGGEPCQQEIYEQIMNAFEGDRIEARDVSACKSIKIASVKKMTDEEQSEWAEGAKYLSNSLTEQNKYLKALNSNILSLQDQLRNKNEEAELLWWLVADWSEIYDCSLKELEDKKAAAAVPFEVMSCVKTVPGPIAVKKILQKALSGHNTASTYSVREFVETAGEELLKCWDDGECDLSLCAGFTPIMELLQGRSRFRKKEDLQTVYRLFEEKYDTAFLDRKMSAIDFAWQLYLECELMRLL